MENLENIIMLEKLGFVIGTAAVASAILGYSTMKALQGICVLADRKEKVDQLRGKYERGELKIRPTIFNVYKIRDNYEQYRR